MAAPLFATVAQSEHQLSDPSFGRNKHVSLHRWVPWIAGFSADFVNDCFRRFLGIRTPQRTCVLDPFAGVGTTLVEGFLEGRNVIGFEINPYAALASRVKLEAAQISERKLALYLRCFERFLRPRCDGNNGYAPRTRRPEGFSGRTEFFSPKVERKVLFALDYINCVEDRRIRDLFRLALGSVMVSFSNYSYEPSLTRRVAVGKEPIKDHDVCATVTHKISSMADDISWLRKQVNAFPNHSGAKIYADSIFSIEEVIGSRKQFVDLVVTSPPYLNNYHYPRNTRPQMHWLGLTSCKGYVGARAGQTTSPLISTMFFAFVKY